jgi:glycosyltransferase involved in cell wall biosynthesis
VRHPIDHVAVLIPARNEEVLLPRCIASVVRACAILPSEVTSDIVVAVDSSTDATYSIAKSMLGAMGRVIQMNVGSVGKARSLAAQAALETHPRVPSHCWLANTDADCEVPDTWLLDQLELASLGAQAIAGTVDVDDFTEHLPGVDLRFRQTYVIHADGTHPHVHGANIGMRADVYLQAGGWSSRPTAEDHDLWNRLTSFGCRKQSIARLRVLTSGRRIGRAPDGFAKALAAHNEGVE